MPKFGKWILTLGLVAATPAMAVADGPFGKFFNRGGSKTATTRSNQDVANDIAKALRSAKLNKHEMDVEFTKGVCTLIGTVSTAQQRAEATRIVSQIPGVKQVKNQLSVLNARPAARVNYLKTQDARGVQRAGYTGQRNTARGGIQLTGADNAPAVSNQKMAENIARALQAARFSGYDMEVRYQNGVALLAGSVSSPQQKARATQIVQQVSGVRAVNNQLRAPGLPQQQAIRQAAAYQQRAGRFQQAGPYQQQPGRFQQAGAYQPTPPMAPPAMAGPAGYSQGGPGAQQPVYNQANLPDYAWPSYAAYPNYSQVTYPKQYSASAWPYIGPFYPYPQVPMGWRKAQLEWDDGYWSLNFRPRTERWWWFLNPNNW